MRLHHGDERVTLWHGDALEVLRSLPDASVDSVVTDPPYGLEFMGREWDKFAPQNTTAQRSNAGGFGAEEGKPWNKARAGTKGVRSTFRCRTCQGWSGTFSEARAKRQKACECETPDYDYAGAPAQTVAFGKWCELWTAECLRVLKPGGHLLAFGGTRTWHRLACAVEDAGFEVRDSIAWMYGCHDDRTEILTRRGWVNGLDLAEDDDVAQWATDGTISLVRPTARQRYDYDGPLVRFRNADVDQLVTPNHRVYLQTSDRAQVDGERRATWSDWQVKQAADVNRWQRMRLPAAGVHDGPGIGGTDYAALLGWVWADGGFDASGTGVRIYQSSTNQPFVDEIAALMDRLGAHKRYDYAREWKGNPYTSTTWFVSGELANRVRADLPGKAPTYDLLWRMTADEKRALWDAAMKGDGSKAARTFWQKDRGALEWAQALLASIDCRGKVADDPRGALHWTTRPTVELQARHLADASEDYLGEVWCVTVPSGAFIVRRNGRVSVSGNSGFPKSLDVSKAIDKAAQDQHRREAIAARARGDRAAERRALDALALAEREVVGIRPRPDGSSRNAALGGAAGSSLAGSVDGSLNNNGAMAPVTAPATPDAERWQGWGTALKPSHEPVVVARKPHVISGILDGIGSELTRLEGECRPSANGAAKSSAPTPAASPAARTATAPASAATPHEAGQESTTPTGAAGDTPAQTGTSWSDEKTAPTPLSTVSSWRACWAELCELTSTSTTSTTTEATTDLRTLWSSISSLTVTSTPGSPTPALTSGSTASAVDSLFAATVLRLRATLALSADESATASTPRVPQGAGGASAFEPVVVARKPLAGTVAANVLEHGTGALNIDGCRVGRTEGDRTEYGRDRHLPHANTTASLGKFAEVTPYSPHDAGRWPTNVVLDDTQAAVLDRQSGESTSKAASRGIMQRYDVDEAAKRPKAGTDSVRGHDDSGGASRFFPTFRYEAKAPSSERPKVNGTAHPTVKPLDLMRWLVRLVTPPGGTVLEPFAGSGTTVEAAICEGFHCIAIEREADYLPLVMQRVNRRLNPVAYIKAAGDDLGLFDLGDIS